jgi:hypothetical protein
MEFNSAFKGLIYVYQISFAYWELKVTMFCKVE